MKHSFDEILRTADAAQPAPEIKLSGEQIRAVADRRTRVRRRIRHCAVAAAGLIICLALLRSVPSGPVDPQPVAATKRSVPNNEIAQIQAELATLRSERQQLVRQLQLQQFARRAARNRERLIYESKFLESPEQAAASQSAAYSLLLSVKPTTQKPMNQQVRAELESLIRQFPNTTAADQAQQLLVMQ